MSPPPKVASSAPGKVLLAGGYLVLDQAYSGLVVGLSARIHVIVERDERARQAAGIHHNGNGSNGSTEVERQIKVLSPQFLEAEWIFRVIVGKTLDDVDEVLSVQQTEGGFHNTFVHATLLYVFQYLSVAYPPSLNATLYPAKITILADNDYYSQPESKSPSPRFNRLNCRLEEAHKTGLGSSAALVTALTTSLLRYFTNESPVGNYIFSNITAAKSLTVIHNLSQISHCAAQGKVGSGFDVAAAVVGSCIYRRFSPGIVNSFMSTSSTSPSSSKYEMKLWVCANKLKEAVEQKWDQQIKKFRIPRGLRIVMGDVDSGSSTPAMVKKVLAWRTANEALAKDIWDKLEASTIAMQDACLKLRKLSKENPNVYKEGLDHFKANWDEVPATETRSLFKVTVSCLEVLRGHITYRRNLIREMGEAADVPIEPVEQETLLDVMSDLNGVLGGVVPGAGGYDAVALLVIDQRDVLERLLDACLDVHEWSREEESQASSITTRSISLMQTREEFEGVKKEEMGQKGYPTVV